MLARPALAALLQVLLAAATATMGLLLAERFVWRLDLSPLQEFVLSDISRQVAGNIEEPVTIVAFYDRHEPGQRQAQQDLLRRFGEVLPNLEYRLADIDRSPALAEKYGVTHADSGAVTIGERSELLRRFDEEEIVTALLRITRGSARGVCFVTGHGEKSPSNNDEREGYSQLSQALVAENFRVQELALLPPGGPPPDCAVVVLAGSRTDWLPGEGERLEEWFRAGGQILLLVDPGAPASVIDFLARSGVVVGPDVVLDERNRLLGTDSSMLHVPTFNGSVFRARFDTAVFPLARSILSTDEADEAGTVTILAMSSPDSWAWRTEGELPTPEARFRRGTDQPGPLPVGVIVRAPVPDAPLPGRMIVYGDSDFATNLALNWRGNRDLFLNSIAVLAEDPGLLSVRRARPPGGSISPIYLTEAQDSWLFRIAVLGVPLGVALLGLAVVSQRRRRTTR